MKKFNIFKCLPYIILVCGISFLCKHVIIPRQINILDINRGLFILFIPLGAVARVGGVGMPLPILRVDLLSSPDTQCQQNNKHVNLNRK